MADLFQIPVRSEQYEKLAVNPATAAFAGKSMLHPG